MPDRRTLAVAVHDIEPATFDRCALIREWLADHGVGRVTLLVIPARDLYPLSDHSPGMSRWLRECERNGDAIAQQGVQHVQPGQRRVLGRRRADASESAGLDRDDTRRAVDAGRRVLKLAGIEPRGFVALGYAYTPALHEVLGPRFDWWAGPLRVRARDNRRALEPALRIPSPAVGGLGALIGGRTLRVDVHPSDLEATRRMLGLEALLRRSAGRRSVTYDELADAA